jgi:hypothetical protein
MQLENVLALLPSDPAYPQFHPVFIDYEIDLSSRQAIIA